jgi:mRNA turnover protein 4
MVKGVPTLQAPHQLCTKGKPLTSEQTQLLKLIGEKMVVFRVKLKSRWDSATGEVVQIEGDDGDDDVMGEAEEERSGEDEEMSD